MDLPCARCASIGSAAACVARTVISGTGFASFKRHISMGVPLKVLIFFSALDIVWLHRELVSFAVPPSLKLESVFRHQIMDFH
jgi:hypothetical protein